MYVCPPPCSRSVDLCGRRRVRRSDDRRARKRRDDGRLRTLSELSTPLLTILLLCATPQIGQAPLHIACLWGNLEAVQTLITLGADVNQPNGR